MNTMNNAQKIVTDLLKSCKVEVTPCNIIYLFDNDYEVEFKTENPYVSWADGKKPEFEEAHRLYQEELNSLYDNLNSKIERLDLEGGGEGEGEYCYGVIKIGDTYIKAEWSYYSYNGCEYDYIFNTLHEVEPKQKTITVYERV